MALADCRRWFSFCNATSALHGDVEGLTHVLNLLNSVFPYIHRCKGNQIREKVNRSLSLSCCVYV